MDLEQFNTLRTKYLPQCKELGIDQIKQVTDQYENSKYSYTSFLTDVPKTKLIIYNPTPALLNNFDYLELFGDIRELQLGGVLTNPYDTPIRIGVNLHKNKHLQSLIIMRNVYFFADDFEKTTRMLKEFTVRGYMAGLRKFPFDNLEKLRCGVLFESTQYGIDWIGSSPLKEMSLSAFSKPIEYIQRFAPTLQKLELILCVIDHITQGLWEMLVNLKELVLRNVNMTSFPLWLENLPQLEKIDFGNEPLTGSQNNFAKKTIVIGKSLSHLQSIKMENAGVEYVLLHGNTEEHAEKIVFKLMNLNIRNKLFKSADSNLTVNDDLKLDNNSVGINLVSLYTSGSMMPYGVLKMDNMTQYSGGYELSADAYDEYTSKKDPNVLLWSSVPFAKKYNPTLRADTYLKLVHANPLIKFVEYEEELTAPLSTTLLSTAVSTLMAPPVPFPCRLAPYYKIYRGTFGYNILCKFCFQPCLKEQHDISMDISNTFVRRKMVINGRSTVTCNITMEDMLKSNNVLSLPFDEHIGKMRESEERHRDHLFHAECFERWILMLFKSDQPIRCSVTHDLFYN